LVYNILFPYYSQAATSNLPPHAAAIHRFEIASNQQHEFKLPKHDLVDERINNFYFNM